MDGLFYCGKIKGSCAINLPYRTGKEILFSSNKTPPQSFEYFSAAS